MIKRLKERAIDLVFILLVVGVGVGAFWAYQRIQAHAAFDAWILKQFEANAAKAAGGGEKKE